MTAINTLFYTQLEEYESDECSYSIGPEGSEFYHCTPEILGPYNSSILSLGFNRMKLEKIEVIYDWDPVEGQSIPSLKLFFKNKVWKETFSFVIKCLFYWIPSDLSGPTNKKPLPDLNLFTPFTERDSSLEVQFHCIRDEVYASRSVLSSSLKLKNEYHSLEVDFHDMSFEVQKEENEEKSKD